MTIARQDIIDVLLSTRNQSEGVTADAILGLLPAVAVPDGWRESLTEMVQAMRQYEMDVDGQAPEKHRAMMGRAETLLAASSHSQHDSVVEGFKLIPDLPHGFIHSAYNRHTGEWVYLNHANTWQLFQGPIKQPHSQQSAVSLDEAVDDVINRFKRIP